MQLAVRAGALAGGLASIVALPRTAGAQVAAAPTAAPRPLILMIHGRGYQVSDSLRAHTAWDSSLRAGLQRVAPDLRLQQGDVEFVWYADALRPDVSPSCVHSELRPRTSDVYFRAQRFQKAWNTLRLATVSLASAVPGADDYIMRQAMPDVYTYLSQVRSRCTAGQRLLRALERAAVYRRPVILVAHSLGSLISYDVLSDDLRLLDRPNVRHLVTIGSMLAVPEVYQALLGSLTQPPLPIPRYVDRWTNLRHPFDPLAFPMAQRIGLPEQRAQLTERLTAGGGNLKQAHDAERYLTDVETATVIRDAWCAAAGSAERGCAPAPSASSASGDGSVRPTKL